MWQAFRHKDTHIQDFDIETGVFLQLHHLSGMHIYFPVFQALGKFSLHTRPLRLVRRLTQGENEYANRQERGHPQSPALPRPVKTWEHSLPPSRPGRAGQAGPLFCHAERSAASLGIPCFKIPLRSGWDKKGLAQRSNIWLLTILPEINIYLTIFRCFPFPAPIYADY